MYGITGHIIAKVWLVVAAFGADCSLLVHRTFWERQEGLVCGSIALIPSGFGVCK